MQQARVCRTGGHLDAAQIAVQEASRRAAPGCALERAKLLAAQGKQARAAAELQAEMQQASGGAG